jgi:hypothetical protein
MKMAIGERERKGERERCPEPGGGIWLRMEKERYR